VDRRPRFWMHYPGPGGKTHRSRFVRPDVAIVDVATELSELRGRAPPGVKARADGKIRTRLQEVFVKDGGRWRIASYHNVDVKDD
jgi:hypothetical protein